MLYVGQSKNLFTRLKQHYSGVGDSSRFNTDIGTVDVYYVTDDFQREIYETYAIQHYRPLHNRSKVYRRVRTDKDVEKDDRIASLRSERRRLTDEIYKARQSFGEKVAYSIDDLEYEELASWGGVLAKERRIGEIDKEIGNIKRIS